MALRQKAVSFVGWALAAVIAALALQGVYGHFTDVDSVDDCEIRWEDNTRYDNARVLAASNWEGLKGSDDCVNIAEDTWYTAVGLEWKDTNNPWVAWAGLWTHGRPNVPDSITLNQHYMEDFDSCRRELVATHEMGHAHGLDESFAGNMMVPAINNNTPCHIGSHDISDYETLWGPR